MNRRTFALATILLACLWSSAPASAETWDMGPTCKSGKEWGDECLHRNGGDDELSQDTDQSMEIVNDLPAGMPVRFRMSRTPNDIDCKQAQVTELTIEDRFSLPPGRPQRLSLRFDRQDSPGIALYEWHVCFLIDGTVYRAWRGFDPGPGASLHIHCNITRSQITARDTTPYLCPSADVVLNPQDYGEAASYCAGQNCRRFKDRDSYATWARLNPLPDSEQQQIAEAVIAYALTHETYLSANRHNFKLFLTVGGADPSPEFLRRVSTSSATFLPASQFSPPEGNAMMGPGMLVSISRFEVTEPGVAKGGLSGYCGSLCAGWEVVTVHKSGDRWTVDSIVLKSIS